MDKWNKLKTVLVEEREKAIVFKLLEKHLLLEFILFIMQELEND